MKLIYLFSFCLIIAYACSCKETGREILSAQDKSYLIYKAGDSVGFKHSAGYEFKLKVESTTNQFTKDAYQSVGDLSCSDYVSHEGNLTYFASSNPKLKFSISVDSYNKLDDQSIRFIKIILNDKHPFQVFYNDKGFIKQENNTLIEAVTINNKIYHSVYRCVNTDSVLYQDILFPKYLLFNQEHGILSVQMSNNEKYEINEKN